MIRDVFLKQKRVIICDHMVKTAPRDRFIRVQGGKGGEVEEMNGKLNANHLRSTGQNELIGKFKMAGGSVISIKGWSIRLWSTHNPTGMYGFG